MKLNIDLRDLNKGCPCLHTCIDSQSRNLIRSFSTRRQEGRTERKEARERNRIVTSPTSLA